MIEIIGAILRILMPALSWYLGKQAKDEQSRKDYLAFLEIMERSQLVSVKARLRATEQIDRVKKLWAEEDAKDK